MNLDYCSLLAEVLKPKTPIQVHPTLTYGPQGYYFNGEWFGNDQVAAEKARDTYYSANDLEDVL